MLETSIRRTSEVKKETPPIASSFIQEYSQKRLEVVKLQKENSELSSKSQSFFKEQAGGITTAEYGKWLNIQMNEGVEYLAQIVDYSTLFDDAKWKVIKDNQGFQDAGDDTWFARRKSVVNGEEVPVNIVLLGTIPDGALSMRIVPRGIDSYLFMDKLSKKWETIHTEGYEEPHDDPEKAKLGEVIQRNRNVGISVNRTDLEFYSKLVNGLQFDPRLIDR